LTESVILAVMGGALGLLIAWWCINLLPGLNPSDIPRLNTIGISTPVLLFTLGVSLLTGTLFGIMPAWQASRYNLQEVLKGGGKGLSGNRWGRRMRGALVISEIALSMVVLIGAGLLIKSFARLLSVDAGFIPDNLVTMNLELSRIKNLQRRVAVERDI